MRPILSKKPVVFLLSLLLLCLGAALSGCGQKASEVTPTPKITATHTEIPILTPTPRPSPTPTLPPLGAERNPVVIGFIISPSETDRIDAAANIVLLLNTETGYAIEHRLFTDFSDLTEAILAGEVHLFWLGPLEYLTLNEMGYADALLMTNHLGVYAYGVQFMTNTVSGFTSYFDPETGQNEGSLINALQQFAGTRPCFLNPDSLPGYHVPLGLLAQTSTPTLEPVFAYDYSAIIRALYIQGICDFGIGYALVGDPRIAGDILQDIPDAQDIVETIWQTDGVIPNISLAAAPSLPLTMQVRLQEAFVDLSITTDELILVSNALNYTVETLKTINDDFYAPIRGILAPLELDLPSLTTLSEPSP